jgi:hypothetical protein
MNRDGGDKSLSDSNARRKVRLLEAYWKSDGIPNAIQQIERKPESPHPQAMLADELGSLSEAQDSELAKLAEEARVGAVQSNVLAVSKTSQLPPALSEPLCSAPAISSQGGFLLTRQFGKEDVADAGPSPMRSDISRRANRVIRAHIQRW